MTQKWPVHPDRTFESQKEPSKRPKARPHPGIAEEGPGSYSVHPGLFGEGPRLLSCAADREKHCPRSPERNELLDPLGRVVPYGHQGTQDTQVILGGILT